MSSGIQLAIAGATGAVGQEIMAVLQKRGFPIRELTLLASSRNSGRGLCVGASAPPVK